MNPFNTALIKSPSKSRFDFSHSNTVGLRFGALTPTLCHQIFPGDEVSMSMEQIARLAPMPVPTFVNLKCRHDFFFVPLRLLYGVEAMDKLFGADAGGRDRAHTSDLANFYYHFSSWAVINDSGEKYQPSPRVNVPFGAPLPGSLFDYLGYPVLTDRNDGLISSQISDIVGGDMETAANSVTQDAAEALLHSPAVNVERLFAYHFIWRDWYRFTGIQNTTIYEPFLSNGVLAPIMMENLLTSDVPGSTEKFADFNALLPYVNAADPELFYFGDLGQMKYAHLTKDMFTSVRYGNKPTVLIPTGANGTIPALREASAIQRFIDILSITGQRYFDKVKGLFGVEPQGPKDDRVQFLARYQQFIKVGEVLTTATTSEAQTGDYAGRGILIDGKYLFKRRFTEHGYLFCITSIIPDVAYNGLSREITDINVFDTPVPSLAQVGDQSVYRREVSMDFGQHYDELNDISLGDQFRYYAYKSAPSEVHGFFLMSTARPWSPLHPMYTKVNTGDTERILEFTNMIDGSRVYPGTWNYVFNDTSDEFLYGDRFFLNLDFYENITRALPKYINYHL